MAPADLQLVIHPATAPCMCHAFCWSAEPVWCHQGLASVSPDQRQTRLFSAASPGPQTRFLLVQSLPGIQQDRKRYGAGPSESPES